jgi:hypothetical protein
MGKIINVKADQIKPSQDFIKEKTVGYILKCIVENELNKLPPTPIVSNDPNNPGYIAIDGHNLIIVFDLLDKSFDIFVADSPHDKLIELSKSSLDAIDKRNQNIVDKYDLVVHSVKELERKGISSFKDLRAKYSYLSNLDLAKKHFSL